MLEVLESLTMDFFTKLYTLFIFIEAISLKASCSSEWYFKLFFFFLDVTIVIVWLFLQKCQLFAAALAFYEYTSRFRGEVQTHDSLIRRCRLLSVVHQTLLLLPLNFRYLTVPSQEVPFHFQVSVACFINILLLFTGRSCFSLVK